MSVRLRLLLFFGLLSAVAAVAFVVLWLQGLPGLGIEGVQSAQRRLAIRQMEALVDKERDVLAHWAAERRRELQLLVRNPLVVHAVAEVGRRNAGANRHLQAQLVQMLRGIQEAHAGIYNDLYLVSPEGGRILAATDARRAQVPAEHEAILRESLQPGLTEFVYLQESDLGDEVIVSAQVQSLDVDGLPNGRLSGVLVASLDLRTALQAEDQVLHQSLGSSGAWMLVDRDRKTLVSNAAVVAGAGNGSGYDFVREAVDPGSEGVKVLRAPDGREVLMAYRHLDLGTSDSVSLAVMRDTDEVLAGVRASFHRMLGLGAVIFMAAMGLVLFAARRITATEDEVRELNASLERRVASRTAELELANQNLTEAMQRLEQATTELAQSEKLAGLGALVAGVAHELNTPIGNALMAASTLHDHARGFVESAQTGMTRSAFNDHLRTTQTGTELVLSNLTRAAELINGFKQLAMDQTSDQRRVFRLDEDLADTRAAMAPTLRAGNFKVEIGKGVKGITLDSYPGALSRSIINLINNALLHGFEGRSHGTVTIDARRLGAEQIELIFSDDGVGMSEEVRKRVFEPFFTTKLGRGGSGLGMHIVYNNITKVMGGRIEIESAPGQGTRYRMVLPLRAPSAPEADPSVASRP